MNRKKDAPQPSVLRQKAVLLFIRHIVEFSQSYLPGIFIVVGTARHDRDHCVVLGIHQYPFPGQPLELRVESLDCI